MVLLMYAGNGVCVGIQSSFEKQRLRRLCLRVKVFYRKKENPSDESLYDGFKL